MTKRKKIAVIGGGVSGLAAAKAFGERGHEVCGFERSHDFGGVWELSRSYPDVQTQSPKDLYCYTDHPMPESYPEWPKGPQVHAYLHSYAEKHDLAHLFRLNTNIKTMERRPDSQPGWTLTVEADGREWTEDFDFVSVCTGQFSERKIISHPGQEAFVARGGQVMHSSQYTEPGICRGKDVVILGGSKSATDIAVNAAQNGARSVRLVYRENVWRVPYYVGGINFKRLLYMRAQEQQFNQWGKGPFQRLVAAALKPIVWMNFRGLETILKAQLKLKKHNMLPKVPIEKEVSCAVPVVTPGLIECLDKGMIKPVLGSFESYTDEGLKLTTGETVPCDVAILAVGWNLGVPFLPQEYQNKLVEDDGQYRLYRLSVNPDLPDMGFVGFNSSFCTVLSAEMIANWLVRFADGKLKKQPSAADMNENIGMMLDWRRNERPAAQTYGGLCSAPFHFKHFDELLSDMGAAKTKRSNPFAERFSFPSAPAYGTFLASAPQYRAE